jgi:AcrR family transcriptional regulator
LILTEYIFIYICHGILNMPKPKDDKKVEQIYKATLKLVAVVGFGGLKMGDVAKEAGIATGTLYIYFKDKESLINALYLYLKKEMASQYVVKDDFNKPYKQCFDIIWKKYFEATIKNRYASAFIEQYYKSPYYNKKTKDAAHQEITLIYELLERGKKEKLIKNIDSSLLLAQLNGPVLDIAKMIQAGNIKLNKQTLAHALQMAWDSIKR